MDVSLVSMPFSDVHRPSIALGLLHAALADTAIWSEVVYGNFDFAETIGLVAYEAMQSAPTDHLLGEWCFASLLFPDAATRDEEYLSLVLEVRSQNFPPQLDQRKDLMRWVRAQTSDHVDRVAKDILSRGARIVGCSSVFHQHCASLALLKRIRELSPETVLLLGGANCEGEMGVETLRRFSWVDCVVSGEADAIFADLCRMLLDHGRAVDQALLPKGAISQNHVRSTFPVWPSNEVPRPVVREMDALPIPDYDDYFKTLESSSLSDLVQPSLLAESSRGCWWGEKSHCTFCGLNGTGMKHRSKSPERVLQEVSELSERHGVRTIQFVDNILDMSYFKTLLPHLAESNDKYSLFYEVKSNLKRDEVRLLAQAGVRWIQPGIESLDDNVLRLIGKGNSTLMNLQLLKWSREFGIDVAWNMLCGVPGDSDSWYAEMAAWLPAIFHLQPPSGLNRVRFDRFSPYQMRPLDFGLALQPSRAYKYIYPFTEESLMKLVYSFEDKSDQGHIHRGFHSQPGQQKLQALLQEWNRVWRTSHPVLRVRIEDERIRIVDTRPNSPRGNWTAGKAETEVYRLCDSAQPREMVLKQLSARHSGKIATDEFQTAIDTLCEANVVLQIKGKLLALGCLTL